MLTIESQMLLEATPHPSTRPEQSWETVSTLTPITFIYVSILKGFLIIPLLLFYLVLFLSSLGCVRDFVSLLLLFLRQGLTYPKLALNSPCT